MQSDLTHAAGLAHAVLIPGDRLIFQKEQPVVPGKVIDMPRVLLQIRHDRRRHGDRAEAVSVFGVVVSSAPRGSVLFMRMVFLSKSISESVRARNSPILIPE